MKEFMLLIRNHMDHQAEFSEEQNRKFLDSCKVYIEDLKSQGKLLGAQPMIKEGVMLSGSKGEWKEGPFSESREVMVGYYHVLANDLDDAIAIAKGNPEFAYTSTARVEIRPIKTKEKTTGFEYPKQ